MPYNFIDYSRNSAVHQMVDDIMTVPACTIDCVQGNDGRIWNVQKQANTEYAFAPKSFDEKSGKVGLLKAICNAVVVLFKCLNPTFRNKFTNAIKQINEASEKVQKTAVKTADLAAPVVGKKPESTPLKADEPKPAAALVVEEKKPAPAPVVEEKKPAPTVKPQPQLSDPKKVNKLPITVKEMRFLGELDDLVKAVKELEKANKGTKKARTACKEKLKECNFTKKIKVKELLKAKSSYELFLKAKNDYSIKK